MPEKEITIYDIAREAAVSPATVSRVLTQSARVSPAKRRAVEHLIEKYGFLPNAMAKGLSDTQTRIIGIITADIRNPFYAALAVECEKAANAQGYTVLLCNALDQRELEDSHLEKLYAQRVDAIIQMGCRVDDLSSDPAYVARVNRISKRIPFIITGALEGADCYAFGIDHTEAMQVIFNHLVSMGHRRIALIGGMLKVKSTYEKWMQYLYLMGKYHLPVCEQFLQSADYSVEGGYACMNRLLSLDTKPTAVIAVNDYTAVGALKAINEQGLTVPGHISLISHDNTYLSEITSPKLTSVDYDYPRFGQSLIELAIEVIQTGEASRQQLFTPKLVIRDSCAPPIQED